MNDLPRASGMTDQQAGIARPTRRVRQQKAAKGGSAYSGEQQNLDDQLIQPGRQLPAVAFRSHLASDVGQKTVDLVEGEEHLAGNRPGCPGHINTYQ